MPLPSIIADVFGVVTISLVAILIVFGLLCIFYSVYFRSHIGRQRFQSFGYFNGPWITRIAFVLAAIWWACGEIVRLTLLKGKGRLFVEEQWQRAICRLYIVSNIGFTEPCLYLILAFLLRASLRMENGALSRQWNAKTIGNVVLFCIPMFLIQLIAVLVGPKLRNDPQSHGMKIKEYFTITSSPVHGGAQGKLVCTYPLLNTIILALFDCVVVGYILYIGVQLVSLVINKGLQRRIYVLSLTYITFILLRVSILGLSVLPKPGGVAFEAFVFVAFLALLVSAAVGICILVYYPVANAMALGRSAHMDLEEMVPFDDYYGGASSMVNQNRLELGRNSDVSTKRGSISFRTMIKDDMLPLTDGFEDASTFSPGNNNQRTPSPSASPAFPGRPVHLLRGVPEF